MYNPFPLLSRGLLQDQMAKGKRYFVRQSFARGDPGTGQGAGGTGAIRLKGAFLLRGYEEDEKEVVDRHMEAIGKDRHAFLYDVTVQEHVERLEMAAGQPAGYRVYYAAKKGVDWKPPPMYEAKIRAYIRRHHPNWSGREDRRGTAGGSPDRKKSGESGRGSATIEIGLYEEFGELFIRFKHDKEDETIPFHIIETF